MSVQKVKEYLSVFGLDTRVRELELSSATVELAAKALGTEGKRIAKSISLHSKDGGCLLVVCAGDCKIDNAKFKARFGFKPRMLSPDEALEMTGHAVGGVCPFALPEDVTVYLDGSLRRFDTVFPAAGSSNSALELTCDELFTASRAASWEDVCKIREEI
ncbi:MAG: YbaK/EbsC family protein [Clostridia bacterium]|nr:YbaK/EbsC family protein [Clostridia bacterium]